MPCLTAFSISGWIGENRNRRQRGLRVDIDLDAQFLAQAQALHSEIRLDDVQLFFERQKRFFRFEKIAENIGEVQNRFARALRLRAE